TPTVLKKPPKYTPYATSHGEQKNVTVRHGKSTTRRYMTLPSSRLLTLGTAACDQRIFTLN
uniref:Uncharacterized protein n=1 Tax=Romanomermis culicivorax TaxID=13658 RepID=A0A915IML9_ROMCU